MRLLNLKKLISGYIFIVLFLSVSLLALPLHAQTVYSPFYWVDGKILPPTQESGVSTDKRIVVFYQTTVESGYASDVSGLSGRSGRSGEFMINAMQDNRLKITPGTYKITVIKADDNYGVNPTDMIITGKGYDAAPNLVLVKEAGISSPPEPPTPFTGEAPVIESIRFDDRLYQKNLIGKGYEFIASSKPKIEVKITADDTGIDLSTLAFSVDKGSALENNHTISENDILTKVLGTNGPTEVVYIFNFKDKGETLSDGSHLFEFTAENSVGSTSESSKVSVMSGDTTVIGTPITFPSPILLTEDPKVTLQYELSNDADIDIYIFDITAKVVKKLSFNAGEPGGSSGGSANPNKIDWDLMSDHGYKIGAGIYVWNIVDKNKGKIIGKGKLAIFP